MHSGVSLRVMILAALTVHITAQSPAVFILSVPHGPILTWLNSSVSLPCELSPLFNAEPLEVRWYRSGDFNKPALLYKDHKIQETSVDPRYRGRMSLTGGLERGNVSLRLERVTLEDRGEYVCYVSSEQWYDKAIVLLTVNVLGGIPVLSVAEARGGGGLVNVTCSSEGWSPQPTLTWKNKEGTEIRNGQEVHNISDPQGLVSVSGWLLYSPSDSDWLSCTVSLSEEEKREGRIIPRAPMEGHWSLGGFITLLVINIFVISTLIGLFFWNKKTDKTEPNERPAEEAALLEEGVMQTDTEKATQTECVLKESATQTDMESVPKAWGEVKRLKVDITLEPKPSDLDLHVSQDRKKIRCKKSKVADVSTAPYVISEDKFNCGQLYWEVRLREDNIFNKEKQSWYVGVATYEATQSRAVVPLTPENGFWVFTYEKGKGYYVPGDPQMPVSGKAILTTLGVFLDCDRQMLSFYDAESKAHLHSFFNVVSSSTFLAVFSPGLRDEFSLTVK